MTMFYFNSISLLKFMTRQRYIYKLIHDIHQIVYTNVFNEIQEQ